MKQHRKVFKLNELRDEVFSLKKIQAERVQEDVKQVDAYINAVQQRTRLAMALRALLNGEPNSREEAEKILMEVE